LTFSSFPSIKGKGEEVTRVFYGVDTVVNNVLQFLNQTNDIVYACVDQTRPILTMDIAVLKTAFLNAKKREVKLLYITEITKDNLSYCKQLLTMVDELRHLDGIKGNFYISETAYLAPATVHEKGKPASQIIYSNVKEIIEHQKYVFETLWSKAIPAEQRIKEIEEDIDLGKTEVIQSPQKILELFINMIKSAKYEILLILPTINAFLREERIGSIELLRQSATKHNVNVRIITPTNDAIEKILQNISISVKEEEQQQEEEEEKKNKEKVFFKVQRSNIQFEETAVTTVTIIVIDKKECLAIEKIDDSKEEFIEAIGLATYSNSEPTVMSYVSIFEGLWRQAELVEQLKKHDKMQKEFINIASHEMKTPTQAILGFSQLLDQHPEKSDEMIHAIKRNADRLQRLTNEILDVSRIESQTLKLHKEKVNITEKILNVINDIKGQIPNSDGLQIVFSEPKEPIYVEADKIRLYQIIANLINNAIKFTKEGTISINANVKDNNEVIIDIKDTGAGIESEILPILFTKFATRSDVGTGLGLFISKSIVEAHGGRMWAKNNPDGKGATFAFSLPLLINQ
jgi:two-component system, OmpR family, sensor histidine kinase VicK